MYVARQYIMFPLVKPHTEFDWLVCYRHRYYHYLGNIVMGQLLFAKILIVKVNITITYKYWNIAMFFKSARFPIFHLLWWAGREGEIEMVWKYLEDILAPFVKKLYQESTPYQKQLQKYTSPEEPWTCGKRWLKRCIPLHQER